VFYAVCTQCAFLRAFSERARDSHAVEACPACGGDLIVQRKSARFQTAYVGKVALDLHAAPPLGPPETGRANDA
jgi:predicted RNA-binding Zn-ribbon protein involved in translation (DUF1610 family)